MGAEEDERRFREFNSIHSDISETIERIKEARTAVRDAKQTAPLDVQIRLETLAGELSRLNTELNQKKPATIKRIAGAKHQIKTADQDRLEHRVSDEE